MSNSTKINILVLVKKFLERLEKCLPIVRHIIDDIDDILSTLTN